MSRTGCAPRPATLGEVTSGRIAEVVRDLASTAEHVVVPVVAVHELAGEVAELDTGLSNGIGEPIRIIGQIAFIAGRRP